MQNTARVNQGNTLPFNEYRNFTIFSKSVNATNFVVRFILWEPKIHCNIYFQSIKFGGSTNGCCFLFLVFFIAYSGDQNLYPTKIHRYTRSRKFAHTSYSLLHKHPWQSELWAYGRAKLFQSWGPFLKNMMKDQKFGWQFLVQFKRYSYKIMVPCYF